MTRSEARLPLMSLLRWVASIFVIFWHYQNFLIYKSGSLDSLPKTDLPFYDQFHFLYNNSLNSVGVFWVVSGLLISTTYTGTNKSKRSFIKSRFIRLYPLAMISLGLITILQMVSLSVNGYFLIYLNNSIGNLFLNLLLINSGTSFNGPIYSVTLLIPIYFTYLAFFLGKRNTTKSVCGSLILLGSF
jgi:peptidoglycan/LPS O-acetylase OafA/YrhL